MRRPRSIIALPARLKSIVRRARAEQELDEELAFHLAMQIRAAKKRGVSEEEAVRQARIELRGVQQTRERCRDTWALRSTEDVLRDIRQGLRGMRRSPGFTTIAVLTLAIGIGANTAIFSLVNGALLAPLPYSHPSRLVVFMTTSPAGPYLGASEAKFNMWRSLSSSFEDVTALTTSKMNMPAGDHFVQVTAGQVSASFFHLLGTHAEVGHTFSTAEGRAAPVAVISHGFWKRTFDGGSAIGHTLTLDHHPYVVVGVLPSAFDAGAFVGARSSEPDVWLPLPIDPESENLAASFYVLGRLRPTVSLSDARAQVAAAAASLQRRFPAYVPSNESATVQPFQKFLTRADQMPLLVLFGAVGLVLLIACGNLANLLLARAGSRNHEVAMRAALGATRRRLVQQLLTESILLSVAGGVAGLLLGEAALGVLSASKAATSALINVPEHAIGLDWRVLAFTTALSILSAVIFGLIPALALSRVDLRARIGQARGHDGAGHDRRRWGGFLTAAELGCAFVLLVGAALLMRTLGDLERVRPGFDPHDVLTFQVGVDSQHVDTASVARTIQDGQERLRRIPGVLQVSASCCLPFEGDLSLRYIIEGRPLVGPYHGIGSWRPVSPGYFETMRIRLSRGRHFTDRDSLGTPGVVIINQAMADRWWPDGNALGQRIVLGRGVGREWDEAPREIVGIVANIRDAALSRDPRPTSYVPIAQLLNSVSTKQWGILPLTWFVRTGVDTELLRSRIEKELQRASAEMPITAASSLDAIMGRSTARTAFEMWLMAIFAGIAVLLAAVGVYGVVAYTVRQRTREIGIRMAMGAERHQIVRMVVSSSVGFSLLGILIGCPCALLLARFLRGFLFGVTPRDPIAFAVTFAVLIAVAIVAAWLPARRAARIDPVAALRAE